MVKTSKKFWHSKATILLVVSVGLLYTILPYVAIKSNPFYYARKQHEAKAELRTMVISQFKQPNIFLHSIGLMFEQKIPEAECSNGPFSSTSPCSLKVGTIPHYVPVTDQFRAKWVASMPRIDMQLKQEGWKFADPDPLVSQTRLTKDLLDPVFSGLADVSYYKQSASTNYEYCMLSLTYAQTGSVGNTLQAVEACDLY